jgi:hypothetical protein
VPLDQLFRALPIVLLLGTIPGLAVLTLMAPRLPWAERLAAAPGFSVATVGVIGLVLRPLHIGFMPLAVLPILVLLVAGAVLRHRRRGAAADPARGVGRWVVGAALLAGLVVVGLTAAEMRGDALPSGADPPVHAAVAASIVSDRDVLPVVPIPADGSGFVRTQDAFEATDALASELGAGTPAGVILPLALVGLLALPLAVGLLAYEAVADRRVAAVASLLAVGLIFPAWAVGFGDYPTVVDSTLVVPLVLAVARCLAGRWTVTSAVLAGAAVLAMWTIHGLEIPTAVVIGGLLWLSILASRRRAALRGAAIALVSVLVAVGVGYLLTRAPAISASNAPGPGLDTTVVNLSAQRGAVPGDVLSTFVGLTLSPFSAALLCIGAGVVLLRHHALWLLGAIALPLLCALDVDGQQWLHPLWVRVYPWTDLERLAGMEFFVVPVVAAIGVVWLAGRAAGVLRRREHPEAPRWLRPAVISAALMAVLAGLALGVGSQRVSQMLSAEMSVSVQVSSQDVAVIDRLAAQLSPGSVVLNDGVADAGDWITALTPDLDAAPKPYTDVYPNAGVIVALSRACSDPAGAERALAGAQAVFVGPQTPGAGDPHPWSARCIASLPDLRLVSGSISGPAGFIVTG